MTKNQFVRCYLTAVLFGELSLDYDCRPLDDVYTLDDFSPEALERATADCEAFLQAADKSGFLLLQNEYAEQAAYDFYFTSRGHGTGFWDKPEVYGKKDAKILTEIAETFRCPDYYDADGKIYFL